MPVEYLSAMKVLSIRLVTDADIRVLSDFACPFFVTVESPSSAASTQYPTAWICVIC